MQKRNPWKFFLSLFAFVVFAGVSCYYTSESLILSEALGKGTVSVIFTILLVIGFFGLTSLGSKWVVDSLMDSNPKHPWLKLIGGTLVIIAFWLCVSFPTNIHSLLYNRAAVPVALKESSWLETELNTITEDTALVMRLSSDIIKTKNRIDGMKEQLEQEIMHPNRLNVGDSATRIIRRIEQLMELDPGTILIVKNMTPQKAVDHYNKTINKLQEDWWKRKTMEFIAKLPGHEQNQIRATELLKEIKGYRKALEKEKSTHIVLHNMQTSLNNAYDLIDKYIFFKGATSREEYAINQHGMSLTRLTNVGEVIYGDYLHKKLKQYDLPATKSLFYLVLIALLFDLAAFLFFNIAFQKPRKSSIPKIKKPR